MNDIANPTPIDLLADALLYFPEYDDDAIGAALDLEPFLMPAAFNSLMIALDCCPMHRCDLAACADDRPDCPNLP